MLCSCGNKSIGMQSYGKPYAMPEIKDKDFIEYLKTLGTGE